jgi:hypothetical protein
MVEDVIRNQYYLFNQTSVSTASSASENPVLSYLIKENIMVYAKIDSDPTTLCDACITYELSNIEWVYDNNNIRIPYYNGTRMDKIQLGEQDNVYDYISSATVIACNDEIICGENFLSLADCFIGSIYSLNANPNTPKLSKQNIHIDCISDTDDLFIAQKRIFVKTDDIQHFYERFQNNLEDKVIITHNSDHEICRQGFGQHIKKVKRQYSQNCSFTDTDDDTSKLVPIPIGIENRMWFDHDILHRIRKRQDIPKTKGVYFFFSLGTHASRPVCHDALRAKFEFNTIRPREDYFVELKRHKYAVCPRGNGLDTHRLWECLYLDVIPIMLKSDSVNIGNLPIIYLDKWSDLDTTTLNIANDDGASSAAAICFKNQNLSKITMSYWCTHISK